MSLRTDLVVVSGDNLITDRYIKDNLNEHVEPFTPFMDDDFVLMQDLGRMFLVQLDHMMYILLLWICQRGQGI